MTQIMMARDIENHNSGKGRNENTQPDWMMDSLFTSLMKEEKRRRDRGQEVIENEIY